VFALEDSSGVPVQYFTTPFAHLAEGHSIALHGRRLVVSYCEGRGKKGALVCYDFDDQAGQIGTVLDMTEHWFSNYGDAKGVSFDPTGSRVYVTFQSNWWSWRSVAKQRLLHFLSFGALGHPSRNGIAIFGIDAEGRFTKKPLWKTLKGGPRRLENIHVLADSAVVTDPATGNVTIYDLRLDKSFSKPVQVIQNDLAFPHGAKFSPDGTLLLVADNGLEKIDHLPQWFSFTSPRKDRLLIYQRQSA
jgi:hypothetical protein